MTYDHTKELDFFSQNRLIYAFQRNIIANKLLTKYFKWFDVAYKSRNINNSEEDFSQYNDDDIMVEVIKRIKKDSLGPEEHKFISDMPLYEAYFSNMQKELEENLEEEREKRQEEHQKLLKGIQNLLRRGDTVASIADLLVRDIAEIESFVTEIEAKKK